MDHHNPGPERAEPQIVRTPAGEEFVFLPRCDYDTLVAALAEAREELEDITLYDEAVAEYRSGRVPPFPAEVSELLRRHRRPAALRLWRGFSIAQVAQRSGLGEADLMAFEDGSRMQTIEEAEQLAKALDVHTGWLEP